MSDNEEALQVLTLELPYMSKKMKEAINFHFHLLRNLYCFLIHEAQSHEEWLLTNTNIGRVYGKQYRENKRRMHELDEEKNKLEIDFKSKRHAVTEEEYNTKTKEIEKEYNKLKKENKTLIPPIMEMYTNHPYCIFQVPMDHIHHKEEMYYDECGRLQVTNPEYTRVEGEVDGEFYFVKGKAVYVLRKNSLNTVDGKTYGQLTEAMLRKIQVREDNHQAFQDGVYDTWMTIIKGTYITESKTITVNNEKVQVITHWVKAYGPKNILRLDNNLGKEAKNIIAFMVDSKVYIPVKQKNGKYKSQRSQFTYKDMGFNQRDLYNIGIRFASTYKDFPCPRNHNIPSIEDFNSYTFDKNSTVCQIKEEKRKIFFGIHTTRNRILWAPATLDIRNKHRGDDSYEKQTLRNILKAQYTEKKPLITIGYKRVAIREKTKYMISLTYPSRLVAEKKHDEEKSLFPGKPGCGMVAIDPSFKTLIVGTLSPNGEMRFRHIDIFSLRANFTDKHPIAYDIDCLEIEIKAIDRAMSLEKKHHNPTLFNDDCEFIGTKADKKNVYLSPRYFQLKKERKELFRHQTAKKGLLQRRIAHEIFSMGNVFLAEWNDMSNMKKRRKGVHMTSSGKTLSNHGFGKNIQRYGLSRVFIILQHLCHSHPGCTFRWIDPTTTKCTSYDPFHSEKTKEEKQGERFSRIHLKGGLYIVQRDYWAVAMMLLGENLRLLDAKRSTKKMLYTFDHNDGLIISRMPEIIKSMDKAIEQSKDMDERTLSIVGVEEYYNKKLEFFNEKYL